MSYNLPPGVDPNDPHLTGDSQCLDCGRVIPEEATCPACGGEKRVMDPLGIEWMACPGCGGAGARPWESDVCPPGCCRD